MNYYKVLNAQECHNGFQYREGLNVDTVPFEPSGICRPGGLYYAREDILAFVAYGDHIREVTIPEGARVYDNPKGNYDAKKWKADKIVLGARRDITAQTIRELVEEGARYHIAIYGGKCMLIDHFVSSGAKDAVDYLKSMGEIPSEKAMKETIHEAAYIGRLEVLDRIVASGAFKPRDIVREVVRESPRESSAKWAVDFNSTLDKNQKRTLNDMFGLASRAGSFEVMMMFIGLGADPHFCDDVWFRRGLAHVQTDIVEYYADKVDTTKNRSLMRKFLKRATLKIMSEEGAMCEIGCDVRGDVLPIVNWEVVRRTGLERLARRLGFELLPPTEGRPHGEVADAPRDDVCRRLHGDLGLLNVVHFPNSAGTAPAPLERRRPPAPWGPPPLRPAPTFAGGSQSPQPPTKAKDRFEGLA